MSRTTRRILPNYEKGGWIYERAISGQGWRRKGRDWNREHWFHGRDCAYKSRIAIGFPCNSAPKGYSWADAGGRDGKRWAKRAAARIIRQRFEKQIRAEIDDWNNAEEIIDEYDDLL